LVNKTQRIWHCRIPAAQLSQAKFYAYRIDGPKARGQFEWHTFDPGKILFDPYAKALYIPSTFDREAACGGGPNDGKAVLGAILKDGGTFDWQGDKPFRHSHDLIIYEVHVRGFTYHQSSGIPEDKKGTYAAIVDKIPYLKNLGVTAVEIMPVFQFEPDGSDYWGYSPTSFFVPNQAYSSDQSFGGQINEFKTMVRELHKAGIEVILDVVYNHTSEGDRNGPVFSYKGIDNSTYYLINKDLDRPYFNYSGTGNTLHTRNLHVQAMILDSLRYWVSEMHVDGFRFDLASVFSRNSDGSLSFDIPPIFGTIRADPVLANIRLIAEPWDAAGIFQLGKNFPGISWMQWNSDFRDDIRKFIRGDRNMVGAVIKRLYGSNDLFPDEISYAYHAYQSVNFITCHDGFTLYDLTAYNEKDNWANGERNQDGMNNNYSWNCGHEGDTGLDPEVLKLRKQQAKNFCTLLMLANGTPMISAGDEFLRTQKGNNNPYNQDNEITWMDWTYKDLNADFFSFYQKMIAFRKDHPSLSRSRFWREDVLWLGANRREMDFSPESRALAIYLDGSDYQDKDIYVMINAFWEPQKFNFYVKASWHRIVNTGFDYPFDFVQAGEDTETGNSYLLGARSIAVFIRD